MSKPIEASIVVVDDEPSIRELLVASLHFAGFEVNTAASGSEAIEVIERLQPDLIVLDPPRDGIHPKAIGKIIDYNVDRIVYISCKPTSLARDLDVLIKSGYRVEKVTCVDMFCSTYHVETVVLLQRKNM